MRRIFLSALITLLAIGALGFSQLQNVIASPAHTADQIQGSTSASPGDILEMMRELKAKADDTYRKGGWLHHAWETKVDTDQTSNIPLPNGEVIPPHYVLDNWYFLDDNRAVTQAVTFMVTIDGRVIQTSIYRDGVWHNLTVDEFLEESPFDPGLDFGFVKKATKGVENGSALSQESAVVAGRSGLEFTMSDQFPEPLQFDSFKQTVNSASIQGFFDQETGEVRTLNTVFVMSDGTERTALSTTLLALEHGVVPPSNVTDLLK